MANDGRPRFVFHAAGALLAHHAALRFPRLPPQVPRGRAAPGVSALPAFAVAALIYALLAVAVPQVLSLFMPSSHNLSIAKTCHGFFTASLMQLHLAWQRSCPHACAPMRLPGACHALCSNACADDLMLLPGRWRSCCCLPACCWATWWLHALRHPPWRAGAQWPGGADPAHLEHNFRRPGANFGISSPLVDLLLRTGVAEKQM